MFHFYCNCSKLFCCFLNQTASFSTNRPWSTRWPQVKDRLLFLFCFCCLISFLFFIQFKSTAILRKTTCMNTWHGKQKQNAVEYTLFNIIHVIKCVCKHTHTNCVRFIIMHRWWKTTSHLDHSERCFDHEVPLFQTFGRGSVFFQFNNTNRYYEPNSGWLNQVAILWTILHQQWTTANVPIFNHEIELTVAIDINIYARLVYLKKSQWNVEIYDINHNK